MENERCSEYRDERDTCLAAWHAATREPVTATHTLEIRTIEHHAARCRGQRDDREDQHRKGDGTKREPLRVRWSHIIERRHVGEAGNQRDHQGPCQKTGPYEQAETGHGQKRAVADHSRTSPAKVHTRCARRRADRQASN